MKNIVIIGSGNVASHLSIALKNEGYKILQIWSRNINNAKKLSKKLNCLFTSNISDLVQADLYILSVNDDAIKSVLNTLPDIPVVHTSGNTSTNVFKDQFSNYGVLYPLQIFNKDVKLNLKKTPFLVEGNNKFFEAKIMSLASKISDTSKILNSYERQKIHIAAVFASNFTNYMYTISESILHKSNIDFKLLFPLINETVKNLKLKSPCELQTGPAKRKDHQVIKSHLNILDNNEIKNIYKTISLAIISNNE